MKIKYPDYHAAPVVAFRDTKPKLLVWHLVCMERTVQGTFYRRFRRVLLYQTLYKFGFADQDKSQASDDGLSLLGCRITNTVKGRGNNTLSI